MKEIILALVAAILVAACNANNTAPAHSPTEAYLLEELKKERVRAEHAEMSMQQMDEALGEHLKANGQGEHPEPPPEEKPAAQQPPAAPTPGQPLVALQPQMVMAFNPNVGGFTTEHAGYMNLNPRKLPCGGMCVLVKNQTNTRADIAVFVNTEPTTVFSGFQPVVGAARLARMPNGQTVYGYISILPYGQEMEFRLDHPGKNTITIVAFTTMNDGWLQPTFYGEYHEEFPRKMYDHWKKTVYSLPHRSPAIL